MGHGVDLRLTSHPNNEASLFSPSDAQDPHPHWPRGQNPDGASAGQRTTDLCYGRHAHYHGAKDASGCLLTPAMISELLVIGPLAALIISTSARKMLRFYTANERKPCRSQTESS